MTELKNDTRREEALKEIRAWGREKVKGEESFSKLGLRLTKGAGEGYFTLDKNTDGEDDAVVVYREFSKGEDGRIFADKEAAKKHADSVKGQVSKLRTFIKLGCSAPTGVDGYAVLERAVALQKREVARKNRIKGAYSGLLDVARAQLASEVELTDEQIIMAITPKESPEKSVFSIAQQHAKGLGKLIAGEAGVPFDGDEDLKNAIIDAEETLRAAIAAFTVKQEVEAKRQQAFALAAELGLNIAA